jgi:phosphatidate cytidylyltransferase
MSQQAEAKEVSAPRKGPPRRVVFGFLLFFLAIGGLLAGGVVFTVMLALCAWIASDEYLNIMRAKGLNPSPRIVRTMTITFYVVAGFHSIVGLFPGANKAIGLTPDMPFEHYPFLLTLGVCASFFRLLFRTDKPGTPATIGDIATTILGFIYIGWMGSHLVLLRNLVPPGGPVITDPLRQPGVAYVWAVLFATFATDVFAYYGGKKLGKHLLYPQISPKKTVEGALSGLFAAMFWTTFVVYASDTWLFPASKPFHGQLWQAPLFGAAMSVAAQLGDLCESMLKRDAGLKDSGSVIPGHGGFLDRGDGLIFAAPVAFYWVCAFLLGIW